jgi:hypothetical protein
MAEEKKLFPKTLGMQQLWQYHCGNETTGNLPGL